VAKHSALDGIATARHATAQIAAFMSVSCAAGAGNCARAVAPTPHDRWTFTIWGNSQLQLTGHAG